MKILVAVDLTEKADAAVAAAARLARAAAAKGVDVELLNVVTPAADAATSGSPTPDSGAESVPAARRAYLEAKVGAFGGLPVTILVEPMTEHPRWPAGRGAEGVARVIARVAQESDADILVIASKRAAGVAALLLGTAGQALLRISPCPVLVVRPPASAASAAG